MITSMLEEMEKQEMAAKAAEAEAAAQSASQLENGHATEEATEMKELSFNDKVNVISEKTELNNVVNAETATSV